MSNELNSTSLYSFFLTDVGKKYVNAIITGSKFIVIDLDELAQWNKSNALEIINNAVKYGIRVIETALKHAILQVKTIDNPEFDVGFKGKIIPYVKIHDISSKEIGKLIRTQGLVSRTHDIKPMAKKVAFICQNCASHGYDDALNNIQNIYQKIPFILTTPEKTCPNCNERVNWITIDEFSEFINSQEFSIQEGHEDSHGKPPQVIQMIVTKDSLINKVYCGNSIEVVGVIRLLPTFRQKTKSRFYNPYVEIYDIVRDSRDPEDIQISSDDEQKIISLSQEPDIYDKIIYNIAPSIYGMEKFKEGALLCIIGGVDKVKDDILVRGNIHVLGVGDAGMGKSQILISATDLSSKGVFSVGRGISGAGLTAALTKDENTGDWVVEAGTLVLADNGLATVDEIDKMTDNDRMHIHEAMEQQCYDDITEVLTENGWKLFKDLLPNEKVATQTNDGYLTFEIPSKYIISDYDGKMFYIKSRQIDLGITPNHNMFVNINKRANEYEGFKLIRMCDLPLQKRMKMKKNVKWNGNYVEYFNIPIINKIVKMNDWLEFLGYYLSEGSIDFKNDIPYYIILTQNEGTETYYKMINVIERIGFKPSLSGNNIKICSKQFALYMNQFGYCENKFIPKEIMQLCSEQLKILYNAMINGDGYKVKLTSHEGYVSSSTRLADDFQILCLKIGKAANKYLTCKKGEYRKLPEGRYGYATNDIFELSVIREGQCEPSINHSNKYKHITEGTYKGKIYCVEVPNHLLYVRRNGIPIWCGNTVTIHKGGRHVKLRAKTAVLAAANPNSGRFNSDESVFDQVKFPATLFSRFDLIFTFIDEADIEHDKKVISQIANCSIIQSTINRDLLKKYLAYAKLIRPVISKEAEEFLSKYFLDIRSTMHNNKVKIPITYRQFEGLCRIAEAHAKVLLKEKVDLDDAMSAKRIFDEYMKDIKFDIIGQETDQSKKKRDINKLILSTIKNLLPMYPNGVPEFYLIQQLEKQSIPNALNKIFEMNKIGEIMQHYEGETRYYTLS